MMEITFPHYHTLILTSLLTIQVQRLTPPLVEGSGFYFQLCISNCLNTSLNIEDLLLTTTQNDNYTFLSPELTFSPKSHDFYF